MTSTSTKTIICDQDAIATLCSIQQQFVAIWNKNEEDWTHPEDDHALPHGATYTASIHPCAGGKIGASFILPGWETHVCLLAKRPWRHWHDGWSFKRNPLSVGQIRKVVVIGHIDEFEQWLGKVSAPSGVA